MASTLRFDNWEDSNGTPILDGTNLALPSSALPAGSVLQVVSTTKTDTFSTTSSSFVDVTGLSVSITPVSTNSKILILLDMNITSNVTGGCGIQYRINGGNADTFVGDAAGTRTRAIRGYRSQGSNGVQFNWRESLMPATGTFLDSPNTTSSITYSAQVQINTNTLYVNRGDGDGDATSITRGASSITLMEIAG